MLELKSNCYKNLIFVISIIILIVTKLLELEGNCYRNLTFVIFVYPRYVFFIYYFHFMDVWVEYKSGICRGGVC